MSRPERSRYFQQKHGGGVAPFVYPTLSDPTKQSLWIDRFQSYKDDNVTLAIAGEAVKSIKLPSGWDVLSPGGSIVQTTLADRPTYKADGLQSNGTSTKMVFPAALPLSGDFTLWFVQSSVSTSAAVGLAGDGSVSSFDCVGMDHGADLNYTIDTSIGIAQFTPDRSYCIRRLKRTGGVIYYKRPGQVEVATACAGTINLGSFLARLGNAQYSATTSRMCQYVLYRKFVTNGDADDLAVIAKLQARETGVTGP